MLIWCHYHVMSYDIIEIIQKLVGWTLEALSVDAAKEVSSPVSALIV